MKPELLERHGGKYLRETGNTVTEEDAAFLFGLTLLLRPSCIAEVGTGDNRSLRAFCNAKEWLKDNLDHDCVIWSCDNRIKAIDMAKAEELPANLVLGDAEALGDAMSECPELIFIDGPHQEPELSQSYMELHEIAAPGAVFVFHDPLSHPDVGALVAKLGAVVLPGPDGMAMWRAP